MSRSVRAVLPSLAMAGVELVLAAAVLAAACVAFAAEGTHATAGAAATTAAAHGATATPGAARKPLYAGGLPRPWPELGVEIVAVMPSAGGRMVDLRLRVLDPARAMPLVGDRGAVQLRLVHDRTRKVLAVPVSHLGPLRARIGEPTPGRIYSVIFSNPGVVRPGDSVTLVAGEKRLSGLLCGS